jgi:hypothetical protein
MSKTEFKETADTLFNLECDFDLLNKKVSGVHFWERIRHSAYQKILHSIHDFRADGESNGGASEYISAVNSFIKNIFVRNPYFATESELLFYSTGRRKKFDDGLWWDIYADPIIEKVSRSCVCFERPYNTSHFKPAKTDSLCNTDLIEYSGHILHKTGLSSIEISEAEKELIELIEEEIKSRFGVSVAIESMVKEDLSKRKVRLPLYRSLIRMIEPEIVLIINSYNGRETFVEACRGEDTPVAELQHGVISRYHMGYSFPGRNKNVFPDYFFSFGDFWSDSVDIPLPDERIYSVGYPYLETKVDEYAGARKRDKVVFISQGTVGERLSRFAQRLSKHQDVEEEVVYKMHPNEQASWEERYPWLVDSDVTVVADNPPLYQLLSESKRQVGVYSTALYEGLYFGLDTYILEAPGSEYMDYLIEEEHASLVSSVEEYVSERGCSDTSQIDRGYFFINDSVSRFNAAVDDILEE